MVSLNLKYIFHIIIGCKIYLRFPALNHQLEMWTFTRKAVIVRGATGSTYHVSKQSNHLFSPQLPPPSNVFFQFFLIPKCLSYNCRHTSPLAFKDLYFKASLILNRAPEIKNTTSWTKLWALTHLYSGHEWLSEHYLNFLTSAVFVYESERGVTTRNQAARGV